MSDPMETFRRGVIGEVARLEKEREDERARIEKAANVASALRALGHDVMMTADGRITLNLTADQGAFIATLGPLPLDS